MTPRQRAILTSIGVTLGDFPDSIGLDYSKPPKLVMTLTQKAAGFSNPINMQDTKACFEAWCLIIKAKTSNPGLKIELEVKNITKILEQKSLKQNRKLDILLIFILEKNGICLLLNLSNNILMKILMLTP